MIADNFMYDGVLASDYGLIICDFGGGNGGSETVSVGAELNFNMVSVRHGNQWLISDTSYDSTITTTFSVISYTCEDGVVPLNQSKQRMINKWLNRKEAHLFKPIINDITNDTYSGVYYEGSFNAINAIFMNSQVVGYELTFISNRPYAITLFQDALNTDTKEYEVEINNAIGPIFEYDELKNTEYIRVYGTPGQEYIFSYNYGSDTAPAMLVCEMNNDGYYDIDVQNEFDMSNENLSLLLNKFSVFGDGAQEFTASAKPIKSDENVLVIQDVSDEVGYIYPNLKITCLSAGDLEINNSIEDRTTIIKNCQENEIISFDEQLNISSNMEHETLTNDFNYVFFRIANTYNDYENVITTSIPCSIEYNYKPVIKGVGI